MTIEKAITINKVPKAFIGQALSMEDLDLFLETSEARGGTHVRKRILQTINDNNYVAWHSLFVGYRGCGKSTELNKLQQDIINNGNEYLVINFSVFKELDPNNIHYIELFIVTMEKLFNAAEEFGITISKEYWDKIKLWDSSTEVTKIKDTHFGVDFEAGVETTMGIPYFQKLFAKLKATAKTTRSFKEVLTTEIEPRLADLIENCNYLITEVRHGLISIGKKDLLIIIEDIDKISAQSSNDLFVNHSGQLTQLNANMIFTFPIGLYCSKHFAKIKPFFIDSYELPMIKVREKNGDESPIGIETIQQIVAKRMDLNLFENMVILKQMILMSGGCLRDLFLLIKEAAEIARDYDREKISETDYKKSLNKLKNDYQRYLSDEKIEDTFYPVQQMYDVLINLIKHDKNDTTLMMLKLRETQCVFSYNGEFWCAVHPVVKLILEDKKLLN
ncbi:MAG: hypothetical protein ACEQSR_03945 [Candidatus Methylacidiphilales bacterium]